MSYRHDALDIVVIIILDMVIEGEGGVVVVGPMVPVGVAAG